MVLLGIFVVINLNILLHRWIVQEEQTQGDKVTKKQIIKTKIKELLKVKRLVENLFLPGNEMFLLKVN
jgi:hypothetical protein